MKPATLEGFFFIVRIVSWFLKIHVALCLLNLRAGRGFLPLQTVVSFIPVYELEPKGNPKKLNELASSKPAAMKRTQGFLEYRLLYILMAVYLP